MPKCPKCGKEINSLDIVSTENGILRIGEDGNVEIEWASDYGPENIKYEAYCPECGEKIFDDIDEAIAFLEEDKNNQ